MIRKFLLFLESSQYVKILYKSFIEDLKSLGRKFIIFFKSIKLQLYLLNMGVPLRKIKESYIFIGNYHLEIKPHHGLFLHNTHRLHDTFPHIIALDNDQQSLDDLSVLLDNTFCFLENNRINFENLNDTINKLSKNHLFDSIALSFTLEHLNKNQLSNLFHTIYQALNFSGVCFGVSLCNEYISPQLIEEYLNQYQLEGMGTLKVGKCVIFRFAKQKLEKDFSAKRLTPEKVQGKKIRFSRDQLLKKTTKIAEIIANSKNNNHND